MDAWDMIRYVESIVSNDLIQRLLISLVILLASIIVLEITKRILLRITAGRVRERRAAENTFRMVKAVVASVTFLLILYVITKQVIVVYFILVAIVVVMLASWELIANLMSYYAILLYEVVTPGEYVEIGEYSGRVREVTPLYTIVEDDYGVYAVPNRLLVSKGRRLRREPVVVTVTVRVWGLEEPRSLEDLLQGIRERLEPALRMISAVPSEVTHYIDEISADSVSIKLEVLMPGPRVSKARLDSLLREIAAFMWSTGYSFSVSVESVGGWRVR